jgi:hypothetical protein
MDQKLSTKDGIGAQLVVLRKYLWVIFFLYLSVNWGCRVLGDSLSGHWIDSSGARKKDIMVGVDVTRVFGF